MVSPHEVANGLTPTNRDHYIESGRRRYAEWKQEKERTTAQQYTREQGLDNQLQQERAQKEAYKEQAEENERMLVGLGEQLEGERLKYGDIESMLEKAKESIGTYDITIAGLQQQQYEAQETIRNLQQEHADKDKGVMELQSKVTQQQQQYEATVYGWQQERQMWESQVQAFQAHDAALQQQIAALSTGGGGVPLEPARVPTIALVTAAPVECQTDCTGPVVPHNPAGSLDQGSQTVDLHTNGGHHSNGVGPSDVAATDVTQDLGGGAAAVAAEPAHVAPAEGVAAATNGGVVPSSTGAARLRPSGRVSTASTSHNTTLFSVLLIQSLVTLLTGKRWMAKQQTEDESGAQAM